MVTTTLAPAALAAGERVYAIGDVHGCDDRLAAMHAAIVADLDDRPVERAEVIHLGDYIDRGPASAAVIARLIAPFPAVRGAAPTVVNLIGNHEDMLLAALAGGRAAGEHWLANGGGETLASWGLDWRGGPGGWARGIPSDQLALLRGLAPLHRAGGYIFVHAGLRPGVRMEFQTRRDMIWIREPFLSFDGVLPGVVVHGHTPEPHPVVRANRIGVDTGAVLGGALSCAVLEADRVGFLQS
jgi:serine/threonine protein phosphatase 1